VNSCARTDLSMNRALEFFSITVTGLTIAFLLQVLLVRVPPSPLLNGALGIPSRSFPVTYLNSNVESLSSYQRIVLPYADSTTADVTAIILNWSRLPNVIRIVSLLCGSSLNNTIASIFIWNNSPQKLSRKVRMQHCASMLHCIHVVLAGFCCY
jgi:hypothetical protein